MEYAVHNLNPIVLELFGPFAIRWYGLSYLLGFIALYLFFKKWSKNGFFCLKEDEIGNFIAFFAFFGIFLGGRIGYTLLYNWTEFTSNTLSIFAIWKGGMSSHGGFLGAILCLLYYAKKHNLNFWNLADATATASALGIVFGRIANFINGELWGKVTTVPWALYFPQELGLRYGEYTPEELEPLIQAGLLQPRHPSQLYQALCEGLLVFLILLLLKKTSWGKQAGALSAAYLFLYAIARIAIECFREPDSTLYWEIITKGQLYSVLLMIGALIIASRQKLLAHATPST